MPFIHSFVTRNQNIIDSLTYKIKKMKKFLVIATVIAGLSGMQAQEKNNLQEVKKESRLELIPKAGINIATQSIKGMNGEKSKVGFQGGVGLNIKTGLGGFSVQPEVNYISKGTKIKNNFGEQDYNFNYIEVPVLAKYSFGPVFVNAGPSIAFQMGKNDKVRSAYGKTKSIDFGIQMGAGVAIPVGPGKMILDGRYNLGFSDIADNNLDVKNRGIAVSLGYAIPL